MSAIEVPYLPISSFKEADISGNYEEESDEEDTSVPVNKNMLFPEKNDIPLEVSLILHGMGMEKYVELFQKEKIVLETFLQLNDSDLQELGITDSEDRKIIVKNLEIHQTVKKEYTIEENHLEDLRIAKNVFNQLLLIQNYCAYIELQMKKHKLTDYRINWKESACDYLKAFTKCALTQSKILSRSLYDEKHSDHLIGKVLKMNDMTLPKHLQEKLKCGRKKSKRSQVFKVIVLLGFCSLVVITGKSLIRRW